MLIKQMLREGRMTRMVSSELLSLNDRIGGATLFGKHWVPRSEGFALFVDGIKLSSLKTEVVTRVTQALTSAW